MQYRLLMKGGISMSIIIKHYKLLNKDFLCGDKGISN